MMLTLLKYLPVYLGSMIKFIVGPTLGITIGLGIAETVILTVLGMMTSVAIFAPFGKLIRKKFFSRYYTSRKKFTRRNRQFVKISKSFGLFGITFLTPVIFSPIIGTLLSTFLGGKIYKIMAFMFISALFWSITLAYFCKYLLDFVDPDYFSFY
ncbi:hypothetical protein BH23BAC1_BH23BAC1_06750 [soil metagenome]